MIKVRQIKIDVKKYSYDKLYNKVLKILSLLMLLVLRLIKGLLMQEISLLFIIYLKF